MEMRPILSSMRRNPTGAILVALQIALALAIVVNSTYIIAQRLEKMGRDPGFDIANLFWVSFAPVGKDFNAEAVMRDDIAVLRSLPGVAQATTINSIPLSGGGSSTTVYTEPGEKGVQANGNYFEVDEHGIETLGVKLIEGRDFDPAVVTKAEPESGWRPSELILSKALATKLFGPGPWVGKAVYDGLDNPVPVVGVIEHMQGSWVNWEDIDKIMLFPAIPDERFAVYLVRAQPGERDALMKLAEEKLGQVENGRIITKVRSLEETAARSYADDRAMAVYLCVVIALLLGISALGIFGLASFNVSTRTKQIGTRRAIGARRFDIVRYFMIENWLVTTAGVLAGCLLALVLGFWLSTTFELPGLRLYYLVAGVALLWAIGLAAAWMPARRAARVSPAVATRTV
jgi:putative ABC transport system permease protein